MPERLAHADNDDSEARERSLADDLRQLIDDGRALAEAELAWQKSRAAFAGQNVRSILLCGALAAVLVVFALFALTLGLVIALAPQLTALGAAGAVFAGLLMCALLAWGTASLRWRRVKRALAERDAGH
jgi:uncharacterized membrane protein YqjE